MTLGGGPFRVEMLQLYSLTETDPMVELEDPNPQAVLETVDLIDGARYDQLYLEGSTPDGEHVQVGVGGGSGGRVELFVVSKELGETHHLVRPAVEPRDALTTVTTGGQETDILERWMPERSEARSALATYLTSSTFDPTHEWELFDPDAFQALIAPP